MTDPVVATVGTATIWKDLYELGLARIGAAHEVRWMLEEASGETWPDLVLTRRPVSEKAQLRVQGLLDRRSAGEPLQYVLGHWAFRGLDLMVDRRVLIPRPETEQVVEVGLEELDRRPGTGTVVDLGTGSGAIALSIVAERTRTRVWATDDSEEALAVAGANLAGLAGFAATRVRLCRGSWWSALPAELAGTVDLVISNPPYVSTGEMDGLGPEVLDWEPRMALEAGLSGLEAVNEILVSAPRWLRPDGVAVLEIAPHQASEAALAARRAGFAEVEVRRDLAGRDRAVVARMAVTGTTGGIQESP
ncbi:MAG TPA: peptide chain release factor N(5)-glutamine methyltransferase [Acidimicrobiales bacterium]|nr:peptide chain release factor N(5)-glutamine methyltransferase [Acidimicrobiales bacterium]